MQFILSQVHTNKFIQNIVEHDSVFITIQVVSMVTREAGKPVNIVTLEPDRLPFAKVAHALACTIVQATDHM